MNGKVPVLCADALFACGASHRSAARIGYHDRNAEGERPDQHLTSYRTATRAMTDPISELLPCPNPWCELGDLHVRLVSIGVRFLARRQVACRKCGITGPDHASEAGAIAGWNTRKSVDPGAAGAEAWYDAAQPAPEGMPVLAMYRAWNRPEGKLMKHVVWWLEGDWRIYPHRDSRGHVDRWCPLVAG